MNFGELRIILVANKYFAYVAQCIRQIFNQNCRPKYISP